MRRRNLLLTAGALAGCSVLPEQPYLQRREWPLAARRPVALPPRPDAPVLLVRDIQPSPGLSTRGLQWRLPDGSMHVDFYEQWAVPPAQGVADALRLWLADCGWFSAVVAPGSRLSSDLVLEGELTAFFGDPQGGVARAALAVVLLDTRPRPVRALMQKTETGTAPLAGAQAPVVVQAQQAALEAMLRLTEQDVGAAARGWHARS